MRRKRRRIAIEPLEQRILLAAFDIREVAKLFPDAGPETLSASMGESVAVDGDVAVVGAPWAASGNDSTLRGGAVFVFQLDEKGTPDPADDAWGYVATLSPSLPKIGAGFGFDVAIQNGVVVVGASDWPSSFGRGAAFVFTQPLEGWQGNLHEAARLEASKSSLFLGASVAIDDDTIVVSANNYSNIDYPLASFGLVYQKPTSGWHGVLTESAALVAKLPDVYLTTTSIDIDSNTVILGGSAASKDGAVPDAGLVGFVFTRPVNGWNGVTFHSAVLQAADITGNSGYGGNRNDLVGIAEGTIVIGAPGYDGPAVNSGGVVLFQMPAGGWQGTIFRSAMLVASIAVKDALLGSSVSIDDNTVAAAGINWNNLNIGFSGLLFSRPSFGWNALQTESAQLTNPPLPDSVAYGTSIAIMGGRVLVGSPGADRVGPESGALSIYQQPQNGWSSAGNTRIPVVWSDGPPNWGRNTERPWLFFGQAVAIDGDIAVVGTHHWDSELQKQIGRAWVFRNAGSNWIRVAELRLRNEKAFATFGTSIAMQGSTIVVGAAWSGDNGAVCVFTRPETGWSGVVNESATLTVSQTSGVQQLGQKVDIDGDTIVAAGNAIGTPDGGARPVAVFVRSSRTWADASIPSALLLPRDPGAGDRFGASLAISDGNIAIGSPGDVPAGGSPRLGVAYVFRQPLTGWTGVVSESAKLVPGNGGAAPYFSNSLEIGNSIDIHKSVVVLGSRPEGDPDWNSSAFVFDRTGLEWTGVIHETARLRTTLGANFIDTAAVTLSDSHLVLGVPTGGNSFFYERPTGGWQGDLLESAILKTSDEQPIGYPVAMSNDYIILGAPNYSKTALFSGAATILTFTASPDFGDAPDSYRTTLLAGPNGGARHRPIGPQLGEHRDSEDDARGVLNGLADDQVISGTSNVDDEDGVQIPQIISGTVATISITVTSGSGRIFAWMDFNRDGDFSDSGEQILDGSELFTPGIHQLPIRVPSAASSGQSFARFRLTTDQNLSWDGPASDGEIEDYAIEISDRVPKLLRPSPLELDNRPIFEWTSVTGAAAYEIRLDYLPDKSTVFQSLRVTGTLFRPATSLKIGNYSIWVRSVGADGTVSTWSSANTFRIATPVTLATSLARNERWPQFLWNPLPGASTYDFWLENSTTGQRVFVQEGLPGTTTSLKLSFKLNAGQYRYWVRGRDLQGIAANWSLPGQFEIGIATVSVGGPSFADRPVFIWVSETGVESYEIYLSGNGKLIQQTGLGATSWSPSERLAPGNYRFWVRGKVAITGRLTPWSSVVDFNTSGQTTVRSPLSLVQTSSPQISWQTVEGATGYRVEIQNLTRSGVIYSKQTNANNELPILSILPDGSYRVWVQAISATGAPGYWSSAAIFEIRTFTSIVTATPTQPTWVADGRPRFQWTATSGATAFDVYLSDGEHVSSVARIVGTSFIPGSRLPDGNWRFWVRAVTQDGKTGPWSIPYALTIGSRPLVTQTAGSGTAIVELQWNTVYGAVRYDVYIQNMTTGIVTLVKGIKSTTVKTSPALVAGRYRAWIRAIGAMEVATFWSLPVDFLVSKPWLLSE